MVIISLILTCLSPLDVIGQHSQIFRINHPFWGELVDSPHKSQWRRALTFSSMCIWINGWESYMRRHRTLYDVTVICHINTETWVPHAIHHLSTFYGQRPFLLTCNNLTRWSRFKVSPVFPDAIFKSNFVNENIPISIKISLKCPINNIPVLVWKMAWRCSGDKPLFEPMIVSLPAHICVFGPQWVTPPWTVNHVPHTVWNEITFSRWSLNMYY